MSFLTPLYLAGLAAIALPILFHLIRRTPQGRVPFSSLMFLSPSLPRMAKRKRMEDWLLLLLRAGVIGLLAFAFARPYFRELVAAMPATEVGRRVALLIDTSASMRRTGLWEQALAEVEEFLAGIRPTDQVAVYAFDDRIRPLLGFEDWVAVAPSQRAPLVHSRLEDSRPGWSGTNLGSALLTTAEGLLEAPDEEQEPGNRRHQIVLVSDLQQGARLEALQGFDWPEDVVVELRPVVCKQPTNAGISWAGHGDTVAGGRPRVRVVTSQRADREQFRLRWEAPGAEAVEAYVPPGESRVIRGPERPAQQTGVLVLEGDDHAFDNRLYLVASQHENVRVAFVGDTSSQQGAELLHYLERALVDTGNRSIEVEAMQPDASPVDLTADDLRLAVVASPLSQDWQAWCKRFAASGGTVFVTLTSSEMGDSLAGLLERDKVDMAERARRDYAMLANVDFRHPLFAPFAEPQYADFAKIRFWRHWRLDPDSLPNVRIPARFDGGDPALCEVPLGDGRIFVLTSSWHPDDSQLALSSKFVPLVLLLLDYGRSKELHQPNYVVGESIQLPRTSAQSTAHLRKPDGKELELATGAKQFTESTEPGIYTLVTRENGTDTDMRQFAVNLPPAESRTAPLEPDDLRSAGVQLAEDDVPDPKQEEAARRQALAIELENRHKLWRWLAVGALGALITETWLAGRRARRSRADSQKMARE